MVRLPTGVPGFDEMVQGGLPAGSSIVLQGPPGQEKLRFALAFLAQGLKDGASGLLVLSSLDPDSVLNMLRELAVDVDAVIRGGRLRIVDWYAQRHETVQDVEEREIVLRPSVDLTNVGVAISRAIGALGGDKPKRAVVELLSPATSTYDVAQVYELAQSSRAKFVRFSITALYLVEKDMHAPAELTTLHQPFDGVIEIERSREGDRIVRKIGILHLKDTASDSAYHRIEIDANGIRVVAGLPKAEKNQSEATPTAVMRRATAKGPRARKVDLGQTSAEAPTGERQEAPTRAYFVLKIARERLKDNPDDADALFTMAASQATIGDERGALEALERLAAINGRYPGLWVLKTKLHVRLREFDLAQEARRRAEENQDTDGLPEEIVVCPMCDSPLSEHATRCTECGATFATDAFGPESVLALESAPPRTSEERPPARPPIKPTAEIVPSTRDAVRRIPGSNARPSAGHGLTNGLRGRTNGLTNGIRGRTNGLTNGIRGRTNGLTNGVRGRTNGLTNGVRGRTNGLTNGLRGRTNGLTNGLVSLRRGITNGLTNGSGFTNGLGGPRFRREARIRRWKLYVIPLVSVALLLVPLFSPIDSTGRPYPIQIDGVFTDWPQTSLAPMAANVQIARNADIVRFGVVDNVDFLAIAVEVGGTALQGGGTAPGTMDTVRVFLDTDGNEATGYRVDGLGADRMLEVAGAGGSVQVARLWEFDSTRDSRDWNGWTRPTSASAAVSGARLEAQASWVDISPSPTAAGLQATVRTQSWDGETDTADGPLNPSSGTLVITQESQAPALLSGANLTLLRLTATGLRQSTAFDAITARVLGTAPLTAIGNLRLLDSGGQLIAQQVPATRDAQFSFPARTVAPGTTVTMTVVGDFTTGLGETFGVRLLSAQSIRVTDGIAAERQIAGPREVGYVGLVPTDPRVDGGFAEWTSTFTDAGGESTLLGNSDVDLRAHATLRSGGLLYLYADVAGRIFSGTTMPEAPMVVTVPGPGGATDADRDTVPDTVDQMRYDFNNDGTPDSATNGDVDADGLQDYGFGSGTDVWLNTTIPATFPAPYGGRPVSVYIGPTNRPVVTGEDVLRAFFDLDNSTGSGFAIGGIGADRMVEIRGKDGDVTQSAVLSFAGSFPGDWSWIPISPATVATSTKAIEFAVGFNASAVVVEAGDFWGGADTTAGGAQPSSAMSTQSVWSSISPPTSFAVSPSSSPLAVPWQQVGPEPMATLIDPGSNALTTQYNHQRKVVRAGDVPGDTACDATNSDGCWYAVFYDQLSEASSNTQASTETITTGSKVSGTFPAGIQTEDGSYVQYREASLLSKVGAFNIGTGAPTTTVPVTGVGFQPKVIIFWSSGRTTSTDSAGTADQQRGFGVAVSTTDRRAVCSQSQDAAASAATSAAHRADAAICSLTTASLIDGLADLSSMDADGFTMVIDDAFATDLRIQYAALGGSLLANAATGMFTESGATGNQDITTVGFQPDAVILFSAMIAGTPPGISTDTDSLMVGFAAGAGNPNDVVWAGGSDDGASTMQTISYHRAGESIALFNTTATETTGRAEVDAWLSNGFSLNWNERAGSRRVHYLALRGGNYVVGDLLTLTTAGTIAETGFGFSPRASLFLSHNKAQSTADTVQAHDELSIGAFSSTTSRGAQCVIDEDGVADADVGTAVEHDEVYCDLSTAMAIEGLMGVQSVDSDGFTLVMDDSDPAQAFVGYLAFGGNDELLVRYDWTGAPAGDSYTLQIKGYRGDENVNVQVLTPPSTWTTRITISATANTMHAYTLTSAEYNSGAPSIRFIDASPAGGGESDVWIDYANIVSNNHWDRVVLMRSSDTSGSTWDSQIILASGRTGDGALLLARDSAEPSIAIDSGGFLHVVWVSASAAGNQNTMNLVRYTKSTVAYPTQSELASASNWETVTNVDDASPGYMPTVSTDTSNKPHVAWSGSKTSGTVYYKNRADIALDAATSYADNSAASSFTFSHTTGGTETLLVVGVAIRNNVSQTVSSITYAGASLTFIRADTNGASVRSELWYRIAPATGANNVVVTLSASAKAAMGAISFTGVDQSSPVDAQNGATGSSMTPTVTLTTATVNAWVVDAVAFRSTGNGAPTGTAVGAQTERWSGYTEGGGSTVNIRGKGSTEGPRTATGSVVMDWSLSASADWATSTASIKPAWRPTVSWGATYTGLSVDVSPQNDYVSLVRDLASDEGEIGYRSNTGTNTVNSPKTQTWDGSAWSAETERATAGSPIRAVRIAWSPAVADTRIVVTLSDDGWLDAYVCTPTCTVTNNIGQVWTTAPTVDSKRFDVAFETLSGEAILVYSIVSSVTTRDLAFKTYTGSWSAEQYIDDPGHATDLQYEAVRLASDPGSNRLGLVGQDGSSNDANAWVWSGSAWGDFVEITANLASAADREPIAIASETNSGHLIAAARDSGSNDVLSKEFTTGWSAVSSIRCGPAGGEFLSLKANPVGDDMIMVNYDNGATFGTCYWSGSAWANGLTQDATTDTGDNRVVDFAWEPTGSKGLLVWGTTAGQITYRTFTAPNTWGTTTNVAMGANTHPWVQLRTNPHGTSVKILGAVLEATTNDLGAIKWDGTSFTVIGASTFTADTGTSTYESFELEYRELQSAEVQYVVCKNLAASNCDVAAEFTKWDGTAGVDSVATGTDSTSYPSLATTYSANGDLWIAYAADVNETTRTIYARFLDYPSAGWQVAENVDSQSATVFAKPSIGIDVNDDVHAMYVATSGPQLYYKGRIGGSWGSRSAIDTSSDNPTVVVRAPNNAAYGTASGALYWKTTTSETYFHYIPEFEFVAIPILAILAFGLVRRNRTRGRSKD